MIINDYIFLISDFDGSELMFRNPNFSKYLKKCLFFLNYCFCGTDSLCVKVGDTVIICCNFYERFVKY